MSFNKAKYGTSPKAIKALSHIFQISGDYVPERESVQNIINTFYPHSVEQLIQEYFCLNLNGNSLIQVEAAYVDDFTKWRQSFI